MQSAHITLLLYTMTKHSESLFKQGFMHPDIIEIGIRPSGNTTLQVLSNYFSYLHQVIQLSREQILAIANQYGAANTLLLLCKAHEKHQLDDFTPHQITKMAAAPYASHLLRVILEHYPHNRRNAVDKEQLLSIASQYNAINFRQRERKYTKIIAFLQQ